MITRIELDGFKTFHNFVLDLGPFQVIVGVNGVGKSNLFDALRLIARLTDVDLRTAFQDLRGDAGELFATFPDGTTTDTITLAVELLIDRTIRDSWGAEAELRYLRLRYELTIQRREERRADKPGIERLYVVHEALRTISRENDRWIRTSIGDTLPLWLPSLKRGRPEPFISTATQGDTSMISLHQDGHGGRKMSVAEKIERTVLSGIANTEFPHALAAREELRAWRLLQLNPQVLREPSPILAQPYIASDGSSLPNAIARMTAIDPYIINDISRDLANLVPGVKRVAVEEDRLRDRYLLRAVMDDGRSFSSRVLSDGTLRLLTLVAFKNDPEHHGVLCFEEPENGVHPFRLERMAELLSQLTTDFADPDQAALPLRQLLVNTHSPAFIKQPSVLPHLLFAQSVTSVNPGPGGQVQRVTRITPTESSTRPRLPGFETAHTVNQVAEYLESGDTEAAVVQLRQLVHE